MLQSFNFLAGGRQIDAKGTFFRYESGSAAGADESIRVKADGNDLGIYYPGDGIELPVSAKRWEVLPVTGTTTGIVRVGLGRVNSARLLGNVRIIDAAGEKTLAGSQFWGSISTVAIVGNVSLVFVKPGASKFYVKAISVQSTVAGDVVVGIGAGDGTTISGGGSVAMRNKLINGAGSVGLIGSGQSVGAVPTGAEVPGWGEIARTFISANSPAPLPLTTPLLVQGTARLYVSGVAVNRNVSAILDVEEVA